MPEQKSGSDKRKYPRFLISQAIELSMGREEFFNARGVNISRGGVLCETDSRVDVYSKVFLMLDFPPLNEGDESFQIQTEGLVMHSQEGTAGKYSIGIQFTGLEPELKEKLRIFCDTIEDEPL